MKLSELPLIGCLFNGIPGPFLAKLSPLWLLYHIIRGRPREVLKKLHERYGAVVQIGPRHYSLSGKEHVYIPKLVRSQYPVQLNAYKAVARSLAMPNVFRSEPAIDRCNQQLVGLLEYASCHAEPVKIKSLLMRYTSEVMLLTTTGNQTGFLEHTQDSQKITSALVSWKFYSLLYGSYLRYHPFIVSILKACGCDVERAGHKITTCNSDSDSNSKSEDQALCEDEFHPLILPVEDVEVRIALSLAATDPAISLISAALSHIYTNPELLQQLRGEISKCGISQPPRFKDLILLRPQLDCLNSVLSECCRLQPPNLLGPSYTAPDDGIQAAEHHLDARSLISIEQTIAHISPKHFGEGASSWDMSKWLDGERAASMKRQLLAYNMTAGDDIEQFQILLASKLLVQIVVCFYFDIEPNSQLQCQVRKVTDKIAGAENSNVKVNDDISLKSNPDFGEDGGVTVVADDNQTQVTLTAAETLTTWLSKEDAEALLTGRLAPKNKSNSREEPVYTQPIMDNYVRALIHDAIRVTHGNRLQHFTHPDTKAMIIGPRGKIPREYRPKNKDDHRSRAGYQRRNKPTSQQPTRTTPRDSSWGRWAEKEGNRQDYFKTEVGYREHQERIKQEADALKESDAENIPTHTFKTTFKQTGTETVDGTLGSVRKAISTEITNGAGETTFIARQQDSSDGSTEIVREKPKAIPPHLRKRNGPAQQPGI